MKRLLGSRWFNYTIKSLIIIGLVGVTYYDLTHQHNLDTMFALFRSRLREANLLWFLLAVLLVPFNWMAETLKWHQLLKRFEPLSFFRAYQAVLAGVSFSLFTPNRVGEYGGRILFVQSKNRWKAIIINLIGNFSQILVLVTFGVMGALYLGVEYQVADAWILQVLGVFACIGIPSLFIAYFNIDLFLPLARRIPYLNHIKRFVKDIVLLRQFRRRELLEILIWSAIRYGIYATQYFLILRFYQVDSPVFGSFAAIAAIFLFQTGVPLPPIIGLVARGNVAVQVWGLMGADSLSVLASTFTLWVINLIIPSFMGVIAILTTNLARTLGYEES